MKSKMALHIIPCNKKLVDGKKEVCFKIFHEGCVVGCIDDRYNFNYRNTYHVLYVTHALIGDPCFGLLCSLLIGNILHICQVPLRINTN